MSSYPNGFYDNVNMSGGLAKLDIDEKAGKALQWTFLAFAIVSLIFLSVTSLYIMPEKTENTDADDTTGLKKASGEMKPAYIGAIVMLILTVACFIASVALPGANMTHIMSGIGGIFAIITVWTSSANRGAFTSKGWSAFLYITFMLVTMTQMFGALSMTDVEVNASIKI